MEKRLFCVKTYARCIAKVVGDFMPNAEKPVRCFVTAVCATSHQNALAIVTGHNALGNENWKLEMMIAHDVEMYAPALHIGADDLSESQLYNHRDAFLSPHPDDDREYQMVVDFRADEREAA